MLPLWFLFYNLEQCLEQPEQSGPTGKSSIFEKWELGQKSDFFVGWGSKFGTTKCRTADISKIRNFEITKDELFDFSISEFILYFHDCLNDSNT